MISNLNEMFPGLETEIDRNLALQIRAGQPLVNVVTFEEERFLEQLKLVRAAVIEALLAARKNQPDAAPIDEDEIRATYFPIVTWSSLDGFNSEFPTTSFEKGSRKGLADALEKAIASVHEEPILVFKDPHPYIVDRQSGLYEPRHIRYLRDLAQASRRAFNSGRDTRRRCTTILLSPVTCIPTELEKEISLVTYPTPNFDQVMRSLNAFIEGSGAQVSEDLKRKMVNNTIGLTQIEAEDAWRRMNVMHGQLNDAAVAAMTAVKKDIIEKSGLLEYLPAGNSLKKSVGGMENLKEWVHVRKSALDYSGPVRVMVKGVIRELPLDELPPLKGIMMVGVPGCGKSLSAKAVAYELETPLVRLDVGRLYEALLGKAEENLRRALHTVDELAPCVLWIDEIEKAFSRGGAVADSGVSSRILGYFLTWMQEKRSTVFVVATANSITSLPPELTRKGRLDEIFYVGLPSDEDRKEIFRIHLDKWGIDSQQVDMDALVKASPKFTGAEVEQAVLNTMRKLQSLAADQVSTEPDLESVLRDEIGHIRPLHKRGDEQKAWDAEDAKAREIAINASRDHTPVGNVKQAFTSLFGL